MSLIDYILLPFAAGLILTHLVPIIVGGVVGHDRGEWIARLYTSLAMSLVGTGLLVWKNPRWRLKKAVLDPAVNQYRISFMGEPRYYDDPLSLMSRLAGRPFGICHADRNVIISPREADGGGLVKELMSEDDWEVEYGGTTRKRAYLEFDEATATVDVDGVLPIIQGSARPSSVEETFKIVELAQSVWNSTNYVDYGIWVTSMGVPFFMALIATRVGGSGAATNLGARVGLWIQVVPW